jgi:hypothetical protein
MVDVEEPERPFVAGMYDYYLGGTANSAADRAAADRIRAVLPDLGDAAWANRGFLQRAVKHMASDWGVRQFLDLGAGLPTQRNTHEVVQEAIGPGEKSAVIYVDIDPRVIERGRVLLDGVPGTAVILGDLRDPGAIFGAPESRELLDLTQPIGVLMVAVTQFVLEPHDPWALIRRYVDMMAPGSFLVLSAPTADHQPEHVLDTVRRVYGATPTPATDRTLEEITRFFEGLEIIPPYDGAGPVVTFAGHWGAEDPAAADDDASRWFYGAVARKI